VDHTNISGMYSTGGANCASFLRCVGQRKLNASCCLKYSTIVLQTKMATMEGSLSKWTNVMKGWQYRWFVLDDNAGLLSYYTVSIH
jgi:hypothetical protein